MTVPKVFTELLSSTLSGKQHFPPTLIFEEGWMLRILLAAHQKGYSCFPFSALRDATWFSEGIIPTPFSATPYAESGTHTDGIVGHLRIRENTKTGVLLDVNAKQFVVLEAKMKSGLSKDVTHADFYDQASRTLACMCKTIELSSSRLDKIKSLGFYVIAPETQINDNVFTEYLDLNHIKDTVERRVNQYKREECYSALQNWYQDNFLPFINIMERENVIGCIKWEDAIEKIDDEGERSAILEFLNKCYENL